MAWALRLLIILTYYAHQTTTIIIFRITHSEKWNNMDTISFTFLIIKYIYGCYMLYKRYFYSKIPSYKI